MATSSLQKFTGSRLRKLFGKYGVVENTRPDWLISGQGERLELDFFIDRLSVAIEVQGRQHMEFIPHFHKSQWDFEQQIRRDGEKADICKRTGIVLFYVFNKSDIPALLGEIDTIVCRLQGLALDGVIIEALPRLEPKNHETASRPRRPMQGSVIAIRDYMHSIESGAVKERNPQRISKRLRRRLGKVLCKDGSPRGAHGITKEERAIIKKANKMIAGLGH